ncbi:hypothetical protein Tco_1164967 [Tanacetum coccineum]
MGSIATWDSMVEKFIMKFHHLSDHNDDEDVEEEEDPNETDNAPEIYLKTYDEYEQELNNDEVKGTDEPWWYDELTDGKLKDEALVFKGKIEGSWGDATSGVMKYYRWLKCCLKNHELVYDSTCKYRYKTAGE